MAGNMAGVPLQERFWKQVEIDESGCWNWTGSLTGGYGRIRVPGGRRVQVHRLSYEMSTGVPIPDRLHVDHLCRNQRCCNPDHLEPVERRVNLLRGVSPIAGQARQFACKNGHSLMSGSHVRVRGSRRECMICSKQKKREWRTRNRERINAQKRAAYQAGKSVKAGD